jgi:hypothetical protein
MFLKFNYLRCRVAVLALAIATAACSDEDSPVDPTEPGLITITGPKSGATVYNSVTFSISAEEQDAVDAVQIKIDEAVVATLTQAPFIYTLDTKTLEDGIHIVSATVTDNTGNRYNTAEVRLRVRNTLLAVYVSEAVRQYPDRAFIFLSDSIGNTLAAADYYDYETGDSIRLTAPGFAGNTFYVTEVYISGNEYVNLHTYTGIARGTWNPVAKKEFSLMDPDWALVPLTIINPVGDYKYILQSNIGSFWLEQPPSEEINMSLMNPESKLLVMAYHEGGSGFQYSLVPSIKAGQNAVVDLSLATLPATMGSLSFNGAEFATVGVTGISGTDLFFITNLDSNEDAIAEFGYPGSTFSRYNFITTVRKDGAEFNTSQMGQASATLLDANVNLTLDGDGRTMSCVTTGNGLDIQGISISKLGRYFWAIDSPPGVQAIVLPEFPEQLQEFAIDNPLADADIRIFTIDFDGMNGYQDIIDFDRNFTGWTPSFTLYDYTYLQKLKVITTEPNGRTGAPSTPRRHNHPLLSGAR